MKYLRFPILMALLLSLTGCAGLFIAGAATTANIATDTRSMQQIWNDNDIEYDVAALNNKAPFDHNVRITANSYLGTVVLMGQARDAKLNQQFEKEVRKIKAVTTIHNQIRIKKPLTITEINNDSWITTKVKSKLLTASELNGIKVKVITEDREVFLFGFVTPEHANIATELARNIKGVKRVIRAFQYPSDKVKKVEKEKPKAVVSEVSTSNKKAVEQSTNQANATQVNAATTTTTTNQATAESKAQQAEIEFPAEETKSLESFEDN